MIRDLVLMSPAQRQAYAAWLIQIAKGKRGSVADRLRQAAHDIQHEGEFA